MLRGGYAFAASFLQAAVMICGDTMLEIICEEDEKPNNGNSEQGSSDDTAAEKEQENCTRRKYKGGRKELKKKPYEVSKRPRSNKTKINPESPKPMFQGPLTHHNFEGPKGFYRPPRYKGHQELQSHSEIPSCPDHARPVRKRYKRGCRLPSSRNRRRVSTTWPITINTMHINITNLSLRSNNCDHGLSRPQASSGLHAHQGSQRCQRQTEPIRYQRFTEPLGYELSHVLNELGQLQRSQSRYVHPEHQRPQENQASYGYPEVPRYPQEPASGHSRYMAKSPRSTKTEINGSCRNGFQGASALRVRQPPRGCSYHQTQAKVKYGTAPQTQTQVYDMTYVIQATPTAQCEEDVRRHNETQRKLP